MDKYLEVFCKQNPKTPLECDNEKCKFFERDFFIFVFTKIPPYSIISSGEQSDKRNI